MNNDSTHLTRSGMKQNARHRQSRSLHPRRSTILVLQQFARSCSFAAGIPAGISAIMANWLQKGGLSFPRIPKSRFPSLIAKKFYLRKSFSGVFFVFETPILYITGNKKILITPPYWPGKAHVLEARPYVALRLWRVAPRIWSVQEGFFGLFRSLFCRNFCHLFFASFYKKKFFWSFCGILLKSLFFKYFFRASIQLLYFQLFTLLTITNSGHTAKLLF